MCNGVRGVLISPSAKIMEHRPCESYGYTSIMTGRTVTGQIAAKVKLMFGNFFWFKIHLKRFENVRDQYHCLCKNILYVLKKCVLFSYLLYVPTLKGRLSRHAHLLCTLFFH